MVYVTHQDEVDSGRPSTQQDFIYRSIRVYPTFWEQIEHIAGREQISVNALINALLGVAIGLDAEEGGRTVIQEACGQWRVRQETKLTARRRAKTAAALEAERTTISASSGHSALSAHG